MNDLCEERTELERDGQVVVRSLLTTDEIARFRGIVNAALLGIHAAQVYDDQALYEVAGGGRAPRHQDQWHWPLDTDRAITMWLPLRAVDPVMGADSAVSLESTGPMRACDASFHLGWILHRANPNLNSSDREVMTVISFADGARVADPSNRGQQLDRLIWLHNLESGELAASDIDPLVGAE